MSVLATPQPTLGALIRGYRLARGWTLRRLADESLGATSNLRRIEAGLQSGATRRTLLSLAEALELTDTQTEELLQFSVHLGAHPLSPVGSALGALLRRHRLAHDWSICEMARYAGVRASSLSRIEGGTRHPEPRLIGKLASALELSPAEHDRMLVVAGYAPAHDPDIKRAVWLLFGDGVPNAVRTALRSCIREAAAAARVAAVGARL